MGIGRTFQNIRLFRNLTVLDNVLIGLNNEMKYSAASAILRLPEYWRRERIAKERALELLSIFNMENVADHLAAACRMARSAGWRLSAHWRRIRACCCWTSLQPA